MIITVQRSMNDLLAKGLKKDLKKFNKLIPQIAEQFIRKLEVTLKDP